MIIGNNKSDGRKKISAVRLYGSSPPQDCGYCKKTNSSFSYGVTSKNLSVTDYESLMLVGWRRSGNYFYKPTMHLTCCPQYSIRLAVSRFQPSKKQRKIAKKIDSIIELHSIAANDLQPSKVSENSSKLSISLQNASFSEEKFELYKKYQESIHGKPSESYTEESFTSFLVSSPLYDDRNLNMNVPFGTMHQLYRLNDILVAVGVLDILPSGVSSVYFFYDVDYKHLSLGKYSAQKEIELCRSFGLEFYYMGFYIHNCEKMKYKAEYKPSELLCPTSLEWVALDKCIPILDKFSFTPLREDLAAEREVMASSIAESETQKMDSEKFDVKESESILHGKTLAKFTPRFSKKISEESIRLKIGLREGRLSNLTLEYQQFLRPLLKEWVDLAGPSASTNIQIILN